MSPKAQHAVAYRKLPGYLRRLREEAGLSQRALGKKLKKAQSWVYNCEVANRRVDVTEFIVWVKACGSKPVEAFKEFLDEL